jgi:hypothetical protein
MIFASFHQGKEENKHLCLFFVFPDITEFAAAKCPHNNFPPP